MKSIDTLILDIYDLVRTKDGWFSHDLSQTFADATAGRLREQFQSKAAPTLRLSQMGPRCPKALWASIHTPGEAEPLPPWAEVKYSYGHIIEAWVLALAKAAGHEVVGEQDALWVDGIKGHRDCVIDGYLVDVKSSSSFGFKKFEDKSIKDKDDFGYLDQLDGYLLGSAMDPLVRYKDVGYLLVVDKQLGHMVLYRHEGRPGRIVNRIAKYKQIVAMDRPPACECRTELHGKSGNIKLDVKASYNQFKHCCFPLLRTFLYANGPVYLTQVVEKPNVVEIDRFGKIVNVN